ncbi:MAG: sensor histidine kinase [Acidiferrobacteraceae bacterium]
MSTSETLFAAGVNPTETQTAIDTENWRLLAYFNVYRLLLALAAAAVALTGFRVAPFGTRDPSLFLVCGLLYVLVSLAGMISARKYLRDFESMASALAFVDIILLTLLMHASGGLASGLGLLLVVAVAGGGFMLPPRMSVLLAALATISVLIENSWGFLVHEALRAESYPQVGMFGVALFATSAISYFLSDRLRATEALAERRGVDIQNLGQINDLIVQRMQSGVVVVGPSGDVRTANHAAVTFLDLKEPGPDLQLSAAVPELAAEINTWLKRPEIYKRKLLRTPSGYALLPRFMPVGTAADSGVVVFLEDTAILRQQAQQMKLAALARLTASIAHEIRNPLGAIANATQLLGESLTEGGENGRLLRIIEDQSRRMNIIVENVLELGHRDHVHPSRTDLKIWLGHFADHYCEAVGLPRAALKVVTESEIAVCVDPDQLDQVVTNLCQNAYRHSPPFSGKALVTISAGRMSGGSVYLDVVDSGTGIPPEVADNIFDPFFTTTPRGTGLGLYIAKELCEGNGARLEYEPAKPRGCRFLIAFPKNEDCGGLAL